MSLRVITKTKGCVTGVAGACVYPGVGELPELVVQAGAA